MLTRDAWKTTHCLTKSLWQYELYRVHDQARLIFTLYFWSPSICILSSNEGLLRSGCYVCEHMLTLVVFPSSGFLLCFHLKVLHLVFAMVCIFYTFYCHAFSYHVYIVYTFRLLLLIRKNVHTTKIAMIWALQFVMVGCKKIGHFRIVCNYREFLMRALEVDSP